jgi:anionic cell wall polymer biosynthesis LytR-Cps2A-Psr (LCP) family protein
VCLREPAHDDYSGADFPAGVQTLDGRQALAFVRQRHGLTGGDLDRTHRQQAFLASAVAKLDSEGVFTDLSKLGALLDVAHKDVVVDSGFDPLTFLRQAGSVTRGDVRFYTLPIDGFGTEGGESVNIIDPARVKAVAQALIAGKAVAGADGVGGGPLVPQAQAQAPAQAAVPKPSTVSVNTPLANPRQLNPPPGVPCVD